MQNEEKEDNLLNHFKWLKSTFIITSLLLILFWIYFFGIECTDPNINPTYLAYEKAFPVPDLAWIVTLLLISMIWLKNNELKGIVSTIAAGSALVFLGLADISFNLTQGIYTQSVADGILNITINLLSLFYGLTLVRTGYKLFIILTNKESLQPLK